MPELPEVETVARQLAAVLPGRIVRRIDIYDPKLAWDERPAGRSGRGGRQTKGVVGRVVVEARRVGKQVAIGLAPKGKTATRGAAGMIWLCVHLRMTGRLLWIEEAKHRVKRGAADAGDQALAPFPRGRTRARIRTNGGELLFVDTRRFGTLRVCRSLDEIAPAGLDPTTRAFTPARLCALIGGSRMAIKPWLLRQDRLVGLGNIYASEILFAAQLDPRRRADTLTEAEIRRLHSATRRILRRAIAKCGTTFADFQHPGGGSGSFQHFLKVYGREGEPCRRCGGAVERIVQQQRSTFFCRRCQAPRAPSYGSPK